MRDLHTRTEPGEAPRGPTDVQSSGGPCGDQIQKHNQQIFELPFAIVAARSDPLDGRTKRQIGHARIDAKAGQQRIHLTAVVCLMIEEMGDEQCF